MMMNKMIVTVKDYSSDCVSLKVFDREKRNSQSFLILKQILKDDLFTVGFADDTDINSHIHMVKKGEKTVSCCVDFISVDFRNSITGYRRCFDLPLSVFEDAMRGESRRILVDFEEQEHTPQFILTDSVHRVVGKMDKVKRRAFVKALTSCFRNDDTVTISKDFGEDFFFEEKSKSIFSPVCGGLCLHKSEVRGKDGLFSDKLSYLKHT